MVPRLIVLVLLTAPITAQEHEHRSAAPERFGTVRFATSCSAAAQPAFLRGVALLHSFDFGRAIDSFTAARNSDRSCAMAQWGIALSRWSNPFAAGLRPAAQLQQGQQAIAAAATPPAKTERERGYIEAASRLYADYDHKSQSERVNAYRDAMAELAARYPADDEAAIFYALSLAFAADPADKTYSAQLQAGAILEKLFAKQRDHPGLAHYVIHTYDVPPLADRALEAARRYAKIAPSAPHALHMPSHTFTRVGYWQESIDANIASAASAKRERTTAEELHASDYQTYAYLQIAKDRAARALLDSLPEIAGRFDPSAPGGAAPPMAGYFALAAIPARYALERGAWDDAVKLTPKPGPFPHTEAMTHFARALGASQLKNGAVLRDAITSLQQLRERLTTARETYWAEQVGIQAQAAQAWLAFVEGRPAEAVTQMRAAAQREDATEKNAVTPGPIAPARELLGVLLLDSGEPAQALKEFEATMRKEPNRFRTIAGAMKAAAASGDRTAASKYADQLLKMCGRADQPERAELQEARTLAANR